MNEHVYKYGKQSVMKVVISFTYLSIVRGLFPTCISSLLCMSFVYIPFFGHYVLLTILKDKS